MARPCGRWSKVMLGALLALGATAAHAEGGRIAFSGMIVESTCAGGPDLQLPGTTAAPARLGCANPAAGVTQQVYTASRVPLSHAEPDRVLRYFRDYALALQPGADPVMVVRTYE